MKALIDSTALTLLGTINKLGSIQIRLRSWICIIITTPPSPNLAVFLCTATHFAHKHTHLYQFGRLLVWTCINFCMVSNNVKLALVGCLSSQLWRGLSTIGAGSLRTHLS